MRKFSKFGRSTEDATSHKRIKRRVRVVMAKVDKGKQFLGKTGINDAHSVAVIETCPHATLIVFLNPNSVIY